jgi:hypothetical protein
MVQPPVHQRGFFLLSVRTRNRQERVRFISPNVADVRPIAGLFGALMLPLGTATGAYTGLANTNTSTASFVAG